MAETTLSGLKKLSLVPLIVSFLFMLSCVKDNFDFDRFSDKISYKPSFVIPAAHGSLTLGNLLEADDSLVFFDPDNSIRLSVREDSLFSLSFDDILELPVPENTTKTFTLDPISLDDFHSSGRISLGDMLEPGRMSDPPASFIRGSAGSYVIFPEVPDQYNMGSYLAESLEHIEYAQFTHGEIEMQVTNNLPVEISMEIRLVNEDSGSEVGLFQFGNIDPQETGSSALSLSGKMVRKNPGLELVYFSSPGSGDEEVFIDLEDDLIVDISATNLLAEKGKARVPVRTLDTGSDMLPMNFGQEMDIGVYNLERGIINYNFSNFTAGIMVGVDLVNVSKGGDPYRIDIMTDEADNGEIELIDADFDFSDVGHNLFVEYEILLGGDDGMTEFDLTGTGGGIDLNMAFSDFILGYVEGYFGQADFNFDDTDFDLDFDLFDKITGEFWLENPSFRLFYKNSVGLPVKILFNLEGESSGDTPENVMLFDPQHDFYTGRLIASPEDINSAAVQDTIKIDRDESNIREFISLPPSKIKFNASVTSNPDGKTAMPNFLTSKSSMTMGMDIQLPLEMRLTDLGFSDTVAVEFDPDDIDIIEKIIMDIEVKNGFPLGLSVDIVLHDSINNNDLYTFENILPLDAADVSNDGFVIDGSGKTSTSEVEITGSRVDDLKQSTHFIVSARLNTGKYEEDQIPVKLQTTNKLDFRIKLKAYINIE